MLIVETIARIRREHFIKGKTIKEIARDLKVSRNTVRKVLRSGETSFEYERVVQPHAVCAVLSARDAGDGVRRPRPGVRPVQGHLRTRHLRQYEDRGGDDLRRQRASLQSSLHADVQPLPGRTGRLYASLGLGEGPSREPGWAGPRALLHATAAVQNPRRVKRLAAGQVHRLRQSASSSRTN